MDDSDFDLVLNVNLKVTRTIECVYIDVVIIETCFLIFRGRILL